jgi:hypothetical protein
MIVGACFEGDVDMALAGVQHDLYFASPEAPRISIDGRCALGWIWWQALLHAAARRDSVPWIDRNFDRLRAVDGFSHKNLVLQHQHVAAYFRWTMPRIEREAVCDRSAPDYPFDLLDAWTGFLRKEIPDLFASRDTLVAICKTILYRHFDASDGPWDQLRDILMRRYGYECVSKTCSADAVAARAGVPRIGLAKAEGE